MAGIKDVAKLAGVGVGTVSRAINDTGYVSQEAKAKIDAAMEELHYIPNELARNLYRKKSGIIAVLVPTISHPFFAEFINYMELECHERGYKTMICSTEREKNYESEYLQMLRQHIVEGIITGVHSLDVQEYLEIDMPIVALDRFIGDNIPVVSVDHRQGGMRAARELIRCGCHKVAVFQEAKKVHSPAQARYEEFMRVLEESGIETISCELEWNKSDVAYFNQVTSEFFRKHPDVDGMFGTDLLALSYMKAAQENGKKIPEDLKIIAYDGTDIMDAVYPRMTMIRQPIEKLAKEAVRLIVHRIDGTNLLDKHIELESTFIKGNTTDN
ncbi:MAG: LacI family DNA-binding transcriptional regulator [Lachnospiraceae bacterium]|nr:LacI family DNA-binding transcriptional regulator [Lachnospiraceae bacterium]